MISWENAPSPPNPEPQVLIKRSWAAKIHALSWHFHRGIWPWIPLITGVITHLLSGMNHQVGDFMVIHGKNMCVPFYHENMGENPEWLKTSIESDWEEIWPSTWFESSKSMRQWKIWRWLLSCWVLDAAGCIPNTYENSWNVHREKSGTRRRWNRSTKLPKGSIKHGINSCATKWSWMEPLIVYPLVICYIAMENGP